MEYFLDLSRLLCPMPVIKVQNQLKTMAIGDQLTTVCTDPGTLHDIPTWCRINGHKILNIKEITTNTEKTIEFLIEKQ